MKRERPQLDFGVITALPLELEALITRLDECRVVRDERVDIRTYYLGTVDASPGLTYRIATVLTSDMGNVDATAATADLIRRWSPKYVVMIGIAGGIARDGLTLGDVVVANQVIEYEYSKELPGSSEVRLRIHRLNDLLLDRIKAFRGWTGIVGIDRPQGATRDDPRLFVGPVASGNKVVASDEMRQRIVALHPRTLAIEMESEGVATAAWQLPNPIGVLVIRGISDMADAAKSDEWQRYAAAAAAALFVEFLRSGPVESVELQRGPRLFDLATDRDGMGR